MITPRRVKQKMYYSTLHAGQPIYKRDDEGNIIYNVMPDGTEEPIYLGESPEGYDSPIEFWNSITGELTAEELQAYGAETTGACKITYPKDLYPFAIGTLIWKKSEIGYTEEGLIDENSADYRVIGIQDTGRHFYKALLRTVV